MLPVSSLVQQGLRSDPDIRMVPVLLQVCCVCARACARVYVEYRAHDCGDSRAGGIRRLCALLVVEKEGEPVVDRDVCMRQLASDLDPEREGGREGGREGEGGREREPWSPDHLHRQAILFVKK